MGESFALHIETALQGGNGLRFCNHAGGLKPSFAGIRLVPRLAAPFGTEMRRTGDVRTLLGAKKEKTRVSTENWAEERERLVRLLAAIESGRITHVDQGDFHQLQAASPRNIAALKERLAELNTRLGLNDQN